MSPGEASWRLAYEISPIYLTRGIAGGIAGATVPLISYIQGNTFDTTILTGAVPDTDTFFAHFIPIPGSTLISNAIGLYPFANQSVAGNALIKEPLTISMMMICPARNSGDYRLRQAILTGLQRTLDAHSLAGGTFSIATPSYLYVDCVFLRMTDASSGETKQAQYRYQLDFSKPLISEQEAQMAYNNLMTKLNGQTQVPMNTDGGATWSGIPNTVGNTASGASVDIVPGSQQDPGLGFAPSSRSDQINSFQPLGSGSTMQFGVPLPSETVPTPADAGTAGVNVSSADPFGLGDF